MDDSQVTPAYGSYDSGAGQTQGIFRGRVEDNNDPLHLGRVRVRVPKYNGSSATGSDNLPVSKMEDVSDNNSDTVSTTNPSTSQNASTAPVAEIVSGKSKSTTDQNSTSKDSTASNDNRSDTSMTTDDLVWATPRTSVGSGRNHGSIMVPDIGDIVFIEYEDGDQNHPVYTGGCWGRGADEKEAGVLSGQKGDPNLYNGKGWKEPKNLIREIPEEVYYRGTNSPTGKVIYKSPKGAAVWIQERDEKECLNIVDRLGQTIRLSSPVESKFNEYNALARGGGTSAHYSNLGPEHCVNDTSSIDIIDSMHQKISLVAKNYPATESTSGDLTKYASDSNIEITDAAGQSIVMTAKLNKFVEGSKTNKSLPSAESSIRLSSADKSTYIRLSNDRIELVSGSVSLILDKENNAITFGTTDSGDAKYRDPSAPKRMIKNSDGTYSEDTSKRGNSGMSLKDSTTSFSTTNGKSSGLTMSEGSVNITSSRINLN